MDKELFEIMQYHRVRCKKCKNYWWSKNTHLRICPDCKKKH